MTPVRERRRDEEAGRAAEDPAERRAQLVADVPVLNVRDLKVARAKGGPVVDDPEAMLLVALDAGGLLLLGGDSPADRLPIEPVRAEQDDRAALVAASAASDDVAKACLVHVVLRGRLGIRRRGARPTRRAGQRREDSDCRERLQVLSRVVRARLVRRAKGRRRDEDRAQREGASAHEVDPSAGVAPPTRRGDDERDEPAERAEEAEGEGREADELHVPRATTPGGGDDRIVVDGDHGAEEQERSAPRRLHAAHRSGRGAPAHRAARWSSGVAARRSNAVIEAIGTATLPASRAAPATRYAPVKIPETAAPKASGRASLGVRGEGAAEGDSGLGSDRHGGVQRTSPADPTFLRRRCGGPRRRASPAPATTPGEGRDSAGDAKSNAERTPRLVYMTRVTMPSPCLV